MTMKKKSTKNKVMLTKKARKSKAKNSSQQKISLKVIKKEVEKKLKQSKTHAISKTSKKTSVKSQRKYIITDIPGFDELLVKGIPKSSALLISGGAGSGKTIFCLQTLANAAKKGEKCLYLSFEESEQRLKEHMEDFGWNWKELEKKGKLKIVRKEPFVLAGNIEAMMEKAKGELLIDINEILEIIPEGFKPDIVALDSVTAIAAAFGGRKENYRVFIEQLFRYLESLHATTFLISETEQVPTIYSSTGVEEFLADGVVVLYAIRKGNIRENAIEVLKLRGVKHEKKIVSMKITDNGIKVYPEQEVFSVVKE